MHGKKIEIEFDRRASAYDKGFEGRLSQKFYKELIEQVKLENGDKVLDVGCGTGELLRRMADKADISGCGIDVEKEMIAAAKKKCPDMNIQIADCCSIPFDDESFDVLTSCMAYHHFSNHIDFSKEASRVLKKGKRLYIADPAFPSAFRKLINAVLKHINIVGRFFTSDEIYMNFMAYGFELERSIKAGYVQVVVLKKV